MSYLYAALAGALVWSFAEYALHHWVFHRLKFSTIGRREHLRHHAQFGYFSPTHLKAKLAVMGLGITYCFVSFWLGSGEALTFVVALGTSYFWYEHVYHAHHEYAPTTRYGAWMRKHHFFHHFHDARVNHGVTSPIWDIIFGTYRRVDVIAVPRKFAMGWLIGTDKQIRPRFEGDYRLR